MVDKLEELMRGEGIDVFGTSDVSAAAPDKFKATPYAITLGLRLSDAVMDAVKQGPTKNYFHHYRTVNAFLDMCALKCVIFLQRSGYNAAAIPASQTTNEAGIAGDFQHKTAANLAGLGFMGKSGLFITDEYGPRVRFATVLTDMKLEGPGAQRQKCGNCSACVSACPCGAITGTAWSPGMLRDEIVDAALCSRHMKEKYGMIGRGAVCGICVAVCPFGQRKEKSAQNR
jgi:epoxyqueuosine reductase